MPVEKFFLKKWKNLAQKKMGTKDKNISQKKLKSASNKMSCEIRENAKLAMEILKQF